MINSPSKTQIWHVPNNLTEDSLSRYLRDFSFDIHAFAHQPSSPTNICDYRVVGDFEYPITVPEGKVFAMAIEGKKTTSEKFASTLKNLATRGSGVLTFVIGGSYGLSDKIKNRADELLSFSDMTFPHTLFRLMLTEQIYRAFSIIGGSAYHK